MPEDQKDKLASRVRNELIGVDMATGYAVGFFGGACVPPIDLSPEDQERWKRDWEDGMMTQREMTYDM